MPVWRYNLTMSKKTIIFDFDGTIANTLDAVVNIYNRVAHKFRCKTVKQEDLAKLQSKKPQEFLKDYGVTNFKLPFLLLRIRKELRSEIANIEPIEGMVKALKEIKSAGFNLGIMTSNSKENVNVFLKTNDLIGVFDFIYSGKNIFGKDKVIKRLLQKQKVTKDSAVYVGDETRDIEAAKKVKIPVVAVSWGFNTRKILVALEPNATVDDPNKLLECLRKV